MACPTFLGKFRTLTDAGKSVLILVKKDDTPQADGNESANSKYKYCLMQEKLFYLNL